MSLFAPNNQSAQLGRSHSLELLILLRLYESSAVKTKLHCDFAWVTNMPASGLKLIVLYVTLRRVLDMVLNFLRTGLLDNGRLSLRVSLEIINVATFWIISLKKRFGVWMNLGTQLWLGKKESGGIAFLLLPHSPSCWKKKFKKIGLLTRTPQRIPPTPIQILRSRHSGWQKLPVIYIIRVRSTQCPKLKSLM